VPIVRRSAKAVPIVRRSAKAVPIARRNTKAVPIARHSAKAVPIARHSAKAASQLSLISLYLLDLPTAPLRLYLITTMLKTSLG
jgi:hypothetical protein